MKYNLNNRFILSSDHCNWILTDKNRGKNNQKSYFPNLKQLGRFLTNIKARECLVKCDISLCNKPSTSLHYHSVIDEISKDLEIYFKEVTNNERN
jgi:hypothetical protein